MINNSKYKIQKLEAAQNQLQTAIKLWFSDGDQISIHTLACAAYQILHDINIRSGGSPIIFDSIYVKNNNRSRWNRAVKEHMNFFKHADKDPNGIILFDPSLTEPFILCALLTLENLGAKLTSDETAFFVWCAINNSDWLNEQGQATFINRLPVEQISHLRGQISKQEFHRMFNIIIQSIAHKHNP